MVAEALDSKIVHVAEGLAALSEKVDRDIRSLRVEMKAEFAEIKAMIKFSYAELDQRLRTVESEVLDLRARVERLEARD